MINRETLMPSCRYVVLGGAGAMGRITVRDLVETSPGSDEIWIADADLAKAEALAASLASPRVTAVQADIRDPDALAPLLQGSLVVINTAPYAFNLQVMAAALAARIHYIDLGGLFHMTRRQLALHEQFCEIQRTALLGMGAAPGISNILARYAADQMDTVQEIHIRVGSVDRTRYSFQPALPISYSLKTILEEFSLPPAVFTKGEFRFVEPMSGAEPVKFPQPVGLQSPMYTLHSEIATLPLSFAPKGIREVSFKIAFDPDFIEKVKFLRDLGFAGSDPIVIGGSQVCPIDVVNYLAMAQPIPEVMGTLQQVEIIRAIVKGKRGQKKISQIVDCRTQGMPEWGIGLDIDTGSPPAIAAQMLAQAQIREVGVIPPEVGVEPDLFFRQLQQRGMQIRSSLR